MSATRDQSQKIAFVYSNLYQIYKDGVTQASEARPVATPPPAPSATGLVIKTGVAPAGQSPRVRAYTPAELIGRRIARPESIRHAEVSGARGLEDLRQSLKNLNELHSRLKFMLQELEELTRE